MKLLLVNDIDTLKSTDNATQVELAVLDEEQQRIDLSQFTTIAVQIGSNGSLYSTETPIVNEEMNTFSFTLSSELPAGTYSIQVNLTTADNKLHIAPNSGTQRLLIEKSFNEVGETIPIISIKSLLDDMAETLVIAKDAKTVANEAKTQVTQAVEASENAVSQVEGAVASANQAVQSSTDAVAVANQAKNEAQTATAASSEAMTQADGAKALSTQATTDATKAKTDASTALSTANSAKSTAESVESRFNELTEGNTNDEVIQARTDDENTTHATLKARLDHETTARKNADAQTLVDAKLYTDTKVGNVDLTALATKSELTEGLATKVNTVEGKGLSTNDYTTAEQNKLKGIAEGATKTIVEDSVASTSTTNAASAKSVKQAYDLASSKANTDVATTTNKGLMSNTDKSKLDGVATGANNYNLPVATSSVLGGVKIANNAGLEITVGGTLGATTLKSTVDNHIVDAVKHVTANERTKWNTVGAVANLKTTAKTDVVSAVNELFTNVSDGKSLIANAITDKQGTASSSDTFTQLAGAISNISTGKKFATGIAEPVRKTHTRYGQETSNILYALQINGLGFIPTIIIYKSLGGVSYDSYIYFKNGFAYGEEVWSFKNSEGICYSSDTAIISKDLVDIPSETSNSKEWIAFE